MTTDTTHRRRIDRQAIGILVVMLLAAAAYGTRSTWTGTFYKAVAYLKNQPSATTGNLFSDQHDMPATIAMKTTTVAAGMPVMMTI